MTLRQEVACEVRGDLGDTQLTSQHHDSDGVQLLGVSVGRHVTKANRNEPSEAKVQSRTVARLKQQLYPIISD